MNEADCKDAQRDCRKEIFGAMFPRWAAAVVIGFFLAIVGTCFTVVMLTRAEGAETAKTVAMQGRDIEHQRTMLEKMDAKLDALLAREK
jgi:hypothetical protein